MIRKLTYCLALLLFCKASFAQNAKIDSLSTFLKSARHDTSRTKTLYALANEYMDLGDSEQALKQTKAALQIINRNLASPHDEKSPVIRTLLKHKAESNTNMAIIEFYSGNTEKGLEIFSENLDLYKKLGDQKGMSMTYNNIAGVHLSQSNYDEALELFSKSLDLKKEINDYKGMVGVINNIVMIHRNKGDFNKAIETCMMALEISEQHALTEGIANSYNNLGLVYDDKGDLDKSLTYYFKSLKTREHIRTSGKKDSENEKGLAGLYNNIGIIHQRKGNREKALDFYLKAVQTKRAINDTLNSHFAHMISNIGSIHYDEDNYDKALSFHRSALNIREQIGDRSGIASSYNSIGSALSDQGKFEEALSSYEASLKLQQEIGDKQIMSMTLQNIGSNYLKMNRKAEAKRFMLKGLEIAEETQAKPDIMQSYKGLYFIDSSLGNFKSALEYHKLYVIYKDSIYNSESEKKMLETEIQHEYDKKSAIAIAEKKQEEERHKVELSRQTLQRNALVGGMGLVLILGGVSYRAYRTKKKSGEIIMLQKQEVEGQKHLIEEKQKEIIDSITYAKRLQEAILPPAAFWNKNLPDSFVLYMPKDIVAGDFFYMEEAGDHIVFAAADCTGHGVPGAMVSVVCSNALNRAVKEFGITEAAGILNKVRELVIGTFEKSESEVKDGMDISFCVLDRSKKELQWAGANNPLWLIRNGSDMIEEFKADKQPIGKYAGDKSFSNHSITLNTGDSFYLFTDGYADQFGGGKGKKFMSANMKKLILSLQAETIQVQKETLRQTFLDWKGDLEQVDDVCVIGVRF